MLNKILILLILFVMGSCSKDELIPNKVTSKINSTKPDSTIKSRPKKKKFRLFKKKKCKFIQTKLHPL
jgi:hypothetical protein